MSYENYLNKLKEYSEWIEYINILKIDKDKIKSNILESEISELNNILLKNKVKTIKEFNIDKWFDFWFDIFNNKSLAYIKKSKRIINEVIKKYQKFEEYSTIPNDSSIVMDYEKWIIMSYHSWIIESTVNFEF
jgi:hypothetical protein